MEEIIKLLYLYRYLHKEINPDILGKVALLCKITSTRVWPCRECAPHWSISTLLYYVIVLEIQMSADHACNGTMCRMFVGRLLPTLVFRKASTYRCCFPLRYFVPHGQILLALQLLLVPCVVGVSRQVRTWAVDLTAGPSQKGPAAMTWRNLCVRCPRLGRSLLLVAAGRPTRISRAFDRCFVNTLFSPRLYLLHLVFFDMDMHHWNSNIQRTSFMNGSLHDIRIFITSCGVPQMLNALQFIY